MNAGSRKSGVTGVTWSRQGPAWVAQWRRDGETFSRAFSIAKFGKGAALEQAIKLRKAMELKYMQTLRRVLKPKEAVFSPIETASVSELSEADSPECPRIDIPSEVTLQPEETLRSVNEHRAPAQFPFINNTFNITGCTLAFFSAS